LLASAAVRIAGRSVAEGDGAGVGDVVGLGETEELTGGLTTFTPLFHTSLVPDLMQVYLIPAETVVDLSLLQLVPALATALAGVMIWTRKSEAQIEASRRRFIFIL
jgi:hypothetical protein